MAPDGYITEGTGKRTRYYCTDVTSNVTAGDVSYCTGDDTTSSEFRSVARRPSPRTLTRINPNEFKTMSTQFSIKMLAAKIEGKGVSLGQVERHLGLERGYLSDPPEDPPKVLYIALQLLLEGDIRKNLGDLKEVWATPANTLSAFFARKRNEE